MRRLPHNLSLLAVSILTVSSFAVAPVFAEDGTTIQPSGDTSLSGNSSSSETTPTSTSGTSDSGTETGGGHGPNGISVNSGSSSHDEGTTNSSSGSLRAAAAKLLAQDRQNQKKQTNVAVRQKACDAHQAELTTREQNYAKSGQKHLDTFNSIYTKVLAFQTAKNLTSADLTSLKNEADAKKAAATTAVAALSSTDVKVDCTSTDPASSVAALKTAVANARTALQDYRTAVKNLVVALGKAVGTTSSSTSASTNDTTGGNQ